MCLIWARLVFKECSRFRTESFVVLQAEFDASTSVWHSGVASSWKFVERKTQQLWVSPSFFEQGMLTSCLVFWGDSAPCSKARLFESWSRINVFCCFHYEWSSNLQKYFSTSHLNHLVVFFCEDWIVFALLLTLRESNLWLKIDKRRQDDALEATSFARRTID